MAAASISGGTAVVNVAVVIPVYNDSAHLDACLRDLRSSTVAPAEIIVVDDGSTDASADVARKHGATVLSTGARRGPAFARNLGAKSASSDIVFFIDSDVCVHSDTIGKVAAEFQQNPDLDALIGSYDDEPAEPDFLSQYRNLMHTYVHQTSRREAGTFWTGCGAVKRGVFLAHGGFGDEYHRPAIEDIELGYRMRRAGCRMILDRDVKVKHLKRWTFWKLLRTDVFDRGIPWTELILRDGHMPNDLNLQLSHRVSVALVYILILVGAAGAALYGSAFLLPLFGALLLILSTYYVESAARRGRREGRIAFTVVTILVAVGAWFSGERYLIPPLVAAYLLLFLRHRYTFGDKRKQRLTGIMWGGYAAVVLALLMAYLPHHPVVFGFMVLLLALILLNGHFYVFLGQRFGWLYTAAAVPFHLLYHFYNGLSFVTGLVRHYLGLSPYSQQRSSARRAKTAH